MLNFKTIGGILIVITALYQLLIFNERYRTGRLNFSPLSIGIGFIILVTLGIILIVKGIKRDQLY